MSYTWRRLSRDPLALVGMATIAAVTAAALGAPWIAPFDPKEQFFAGMTLEGAPLPPGEQFLLGTDLLGRDLLSRLLYGARTSLIIGVVANGAAVTVGTLLGVVAGYVQGWVGAAIMRFTDLMMAFPALLLAIALAAIFTPSLWIVAMVIALVNWVQIARVIYTETTGLAAREYIEAARALGAAWPRILFIHILPHLIPTILVWATLGIATTVLLEATLSFFGLLNIDMSWGIMINTAQSQGYLRSGLEFWWLLIPAGLAVTLLAAGFFFVGRAMDEVINPRLRAR